MIKNKHLKMVRLLPYLPNRLHCLHTAVNLTAMPSITAGRPPVYNAVTDIYQSLSLTINYNFTPIITQ